MQHLAPLAQGCRADWCAIANRRRPSENRSIPHTMCLAMNAHIHYAFSFGAPSQRARVMAERIYMKLQMLGPRQVRLHRGMLLTYPYPAPRGYGTRGLFIGIYTINTRLEWIEEDVLALFGDSRACEARC